MAVDGKVSNFNIANILTMLRIALVPVLIYFFLQPGSTARWIAAGIFIGAALTDKVDGYLARSRNLITDLGKLLDPIADKALVISALVLLSMDGIVPWWVTIVIILRELGITLMRMAMVRRQVMAASKGGKLKTVLQMAFLFGYLIPWGSFLAADSGALTALNYTLATIMYLAVVVTVVTGLMYVRDAMVIARGDD